MTDEPKSRGFLDWLKESAAVKAFFIGFIILLLLIPSVMIQGLISERAERQDGIIKDVSATWSGSQLIRGPVLVIPYKKIENITDTAKKVIQKATIDYLYVLPDALKYQSQLKTQVLHRGIYDVVVYNAVVKVSGNFDKLNLQSLGITESQLMLDRAKVTFGISDLKGLKNNPVIKLSDQQIRVEPVLSGSALFANGLQGGINLTGKIGSTLNFSYDMDIKGSGGLHFMHLGKVTDVAVTGNWSSPSFEGRYLPDTRDIKDSSFTAKWRMLYYNRPYPQQWVTDNTLLNVEEPGDKLIYTRESIDIATTTGQQDAVFGVRLRLPVDEYQKTMRTSKYAILIILLTFVSLFLTELIGKYRVHVFNYILIGAAMVIYYTLLLSFAEQVGFNYAYAIASIATIALIATFIASLLKNRKAAALFTLILTVFYAFIFVIIQLEDLALMVGSIALFVIIAILMYVSRKINFDKN
ncbi:cell envelope integrity protein CreD [Mucilaginibacter limnophilus]|uniref:Cell envelope integrity protein CreD n=1 Tax=Mucilaginibacter limnophilus TaxID=1932778 RepID=A0A3S2VKP3_9SPHI|nr:cell envelope integrity protein CreD [Mucilaginibacter limnophilus]RVT98234.1 cell envelope integrity protein CreD [Mucilaginibacter limnophilus]